MSYFATCRPIVDYAVGSDSASVGLLAIHRAFRAGLEITTIWPVDSAIGATMTRLTVDGAPNDSKDGVYRSFLKLTHVPTYKQNSCEFSLQ